MADSVFSHQDEPSEEPDDKILECDSKAGAGQRDAWDHLRGRPENHKKNSNQASRTRGHLRNGPQREQILAVRFEAIENSRHDLVQDQNGQSDHEDPTKGNEQPMQEAALSRCSQQTPLRIVRGEVTLVTYAAVQTGDYFLQGRQ